MRPDATHPYTGVSDMLDTNSRETTRDPRTTRLFVVEMTCGQNQQKATVRNLSSSGAGLRASPTPRPGQRIALALGSYGTVGAKVCWVKDSTFGVLLDIIIDPEKFRFSETAWMPVLAPEHVAHAIDSLRPATSNWRPGFKIY